jgi:hypothetical protein
MGSYGHTKRILSVAKSHPGARNDKTIVRYDKHMMSIKNKELYSDVEFQLYDANHNLVTCKGACVICDGDV